MAYRSPARWMAPVALLGAVAAVLIVVSGNSDKSSGSKSSGATVTSSSTTTAHKRTSAHHHGRFYVVKPGDVLSSIAARTGVALNELMRLNPNVDAQTLTVGQKLKLTP